MGIVAAVDVNDRYVRLNDRLSVGVDDFARDGSICRKMEVMRVLGPHFAAQPKAAGKPVPGVKEPTTAALLGWQFLPAGTDAIGRDNQRGLSIQAVFTHSADRKE